MIMALPIINPPNPYVGTLRIFPGTLVKINGQARPNATRFAINFQTGPSLNPRDDLALHLSPFFSPPRIIRNSLKSGAWGLEEAWGNGQILSPHQPFEIFILAEQDQFKIAINGAHYCEFKHRIPYQEISHLTIDGDVDIGQITITSATASAPQAQPAYQPTSLPSSAAPYPTSHPMGMPMPGMYPNIAPNSANIGPYPTPSSAGGYPPAPGGYPTPGVGGYPPAGPMPTGASYGGYPPAGPHAGYPGAQPGPYGGGPAPTGSSYLGGYPQQPPPQHQPGHSSSSLFGNLPVGGKALGTLAGLGLAGAAGAAVLSAANPLKHVKKIMKPHKMFKHKGGGWGRSSSSSSNSSISSRGSFSSNSS